MLDGSAEVPPQFDSNPRIAYNSLVSTTLTIHNLDEGVEEKLRIRAALHQRSMEAEVREILTRSVEEDALLTPTLTSAKERMRMTNQSNVARWFRVVVATGLIDDHFKIADRSSNNR